MMMPTSVMGTCRETAQNISDYIEGRTPLFKRIRIRIHLGVCAGCRRWLAELRSTLKGVRMTRSAEMGIHVPPELRQNIERIFAKTLNV
ncbi:MAG: zf-HC2 domain-containing protein [Nitrospirae bacterium]|nr:zf-HC2 domain-containing protein [Nitrospirota bacterium]